MSKTQVTASEMSWNVLQTCENWHLIHTSGGSILKKFGQVRTWFELVHRISKLAEHELDNGFEFGHLAEPEHEVRFSSGLNHFRT